MADPRTPDILVPADASEDSTSGGKVRTGSQVPGSGDSQRTTAVRTSQSSASPPSTPARRTVNVQQTMLLTTLPVSPPLGAAPSAPGAAPTLVLTPGTPASGLAAVRAAAAELAIVAPARTPAGPARRDSPDGVKASSEVRTIVVAAGMPPAVSMGNAATSRRVTHERGVASQRTPSAAQLGADVQEWRSPSERGSFAGPGSSVQSSSAALVVHFATPASGVPRPAEGTELVRRPTGAGYAALVPAQARVEQSIHPDGDISQLPLLDRDSGARAAAFRALRRRLAEQRNPAVILVTSAEDSEGKSTCASNLALAMAESGRHKVLLVEANLRHPSLAEMFGFEPTTCLISQLAAHREQLDAPWATTEIKAAGLHLLAVSPSADREHAALHGPSFSASVARWRLAYDYVVIDGPAILTGCDVPVIHDAVDAVVMVARSGVTHSRTIKRALAQISAEMVAGLVLMD